MMPGWHCSLVDFTCVLSIAVSGTDYKTGISGKSVPCTQRTLIPLCLANLHPQTKVTVRSENICEWTGLKVLVPFLAPYGGRVMSLLLLSSKTMLNSLPTLFSKEANHA